LLKGAPSLLPSRRAPGNANIAPAPMAYSFDIRNAVPSDVSALHDLSIAVARDGRGVVFTVGDIVAKGPSSQGRIQSSIDPATRADNLVLVATVGEAVIGYASVKRIAPTFARHVGVFSVEVHPDHQRRGIGRSLLVACLDWAKEHAIERFELYTRADNDRAQALYESEGFRLESKRVRFIKLTDGRYVDDLVYVRFL
jgi:RimJ/RimL family protein N-acetyltransferase